MVTKHFVSDCHFHYNPSECAQQQLSVFICCRFERAYTANQFFLKQVNFYLRHINCLFTLRFCWNPLEQIFTLDLMCFYDLLLHLLFLFLVLCITTSSVFSLGYGHRCNFSSGVLSVSCRCMNSYGQESRLRQCFIVLRSNFDALSRLHWKTVHEYQNG